MSVANFQEACDQLLTSPERLSHLAKEAREWALGNGLIMSNPDGIISHAPCTLIPRAVPRSQIEALVDISQILNVLFDRLARDPEFILPILQSAADADPEFTGNILQLFKDCLAEGITQTTYLGIHRSDYMRTKSGGWAHIEFNTIASSFGALADKCSGLHEFILTRHLHLHNQQLVEATNTKNICLALAMASKKVHKIEPTVLMVVQAGDTNFTDQRLLEYELWSTHRVKSIRRTLKQVYEQGSLEKQELVLTWAEEGGRHKRIRVSVAYYRVGYAPRDYPSNQEWHARRLIERSRAIKCPNAIYHLLGSKTVQPILAKKGVLERYLKPEDCAKLRSVFAGMTNLDSSIEDEERITRVLSDVMKNPENYVLKPQREGGGNNFFGKAIVEQLQQLTAEERRGYMVMERIRPPVNRTVQMRDGKPSICPSISEIGVYCLYLGDGKEEVLNKTAGLLCRTKGACTTEGGVATGYSVIDSLLYG